MPTLLPNSSVPLTELIDLIGLDRGELAEELGWSPAQLGIVERWKRRKRNSPAATLLRAVADHLASLKYDDDDELRFALYDVGMAAQVMFPTDLDIAGDLSRGPSLLCYIADEMDCGEVFCADGPWVELTVGLHARLVGEIHVEVMAGSDAWTCSWEGHAKLSDLKTSDLEAAKAGALAKVGAWAQERARWYRRIERDCR